MIAVFTLGDVKNGNSGETRTVYCHSSLTGSAIEYAYERSVEKTKFDFIKEVCFDYKSELIPESVAFKLENILDVDIEGYGISKIVDQKKYFMIGWQSYIKLFAKFIQLDIPDFKLEIIYCDTYISILNGAAKGIVC